MQTSNFILINHDVYGRNMLSICFIYFHLFLLPFKFICLHYLDQLHLVSSHASRQMFTMCFTRLLFIIINKTKIFHATFENFLEMLLVLFSVVNNKHVQRKNSTRTFSTCFSFSNACYNFPNRFIFFSGISSLLSALSAQKMS